MGCSQILPRTPHDVSSPGTSFEQDNSCFQHEKHPKGKRKRTAYVASNATAGGYLLTFSSAKDKCILEASYHANPKPDKAARLDIVQRVSLNEKEVQIWFQNRRQNDRRKSRPLSPQEIAALRSGGMQILSSDPITSSSQPGDRTSPVADPALSSTFKLDDDPALSARHSDVLGPEPPAVAGSEADEVKNVLLETPVASSAQKASVESQSLSASFCGSVGYLSNRWNLSGSFSTPSSLRRMPDAAR